MVIPFPVQRPQSRGTFHASAIDTLLRSLYEVGEDEDLQAAVDRIGDLEHVAAGREQSVL